MTAGGQESLSTTHETFRDEDAVGILSRMQSLGWQVDTKARTDYHRHPVVTHATDPEDGQLYDIHTDRQYLAVGAISSYHSIPTLMYPDRQRGSWQVLPLLRLTPNEDPKGAYFLFPNFAYGFSYEMGHGLVPRFVGHIQGHDGKEEVALAVHRRVYGTEETEFKAKLYRLLEQPQTPLAAA